MPLAVFHPLIADWFQSHIGEPTDIQVQVWPAIQSGSICIIDRSALVTSASFKAWIRAMWLSAEKSVGWKTVFNGNALSGEGVDIVERQTGFNRQGALTSAAF